MLITRLCWSGAGPNEPYPFPFLTPGYHSCIMTRVETDIARALQRKLDSRGGHSNDFPLTTITNSSLVCRRRSERPVSIPCEDIR